MRGNTVALYAVQTGRASMIEATIAKFPHDEVRLCVVICVNDVEHEMLPRVQVSLHLMPYKLPFMVHVFSYSIDINLAQFS